MCTLTILPYNNKIFVGFNRDELRTRKTAIPPSFYVYNNIKMIYPKDANFGGTWIGANELGFLFFLLNYNQKNLYKNYFFNKAYKNKKSRGLIIPELLKLESEEQIHEYIQNFDYWNYSPFRLIFFNVNNLKVLQFIYSGRGKKTRCYSIPFFQASSGLGDQKIYPLRKKLFNTLLQNQPSIKKQIRFHHYRNKKNPLENIFVNRKLARTVSQTFILIENQQIMVHYLDHLNKKKHKYILNLKTRSNIRGSF
jgi:uncharacterized protein with NRDE domain